MSMRAFAHCQEFMVQFCYSALNQIDSRQIASFVLLSIFVVYLVNKSGISTICHGAWQVVKAVGSRAKQWCKSPVPPRWCIRGAHQD